MRILQVLPELNVGGVETGTVDLAKYFKREGFHSVVVSNGGELVFELEKAGVKHVKLPVHRKDLWAMWRCVKALRRIILKENIEIVHARSRVPAWIAFFACRGTNAQFITTCHGYYSNHLFSRIMSWPKLLIVPSEVIGRHMVDAFNAIPENIRCIPRSVDLEKFNVTRDTGRKSSAVISIVGRLTPIKGHVYFLKAMAKVVRHNPFVRIWIIGDTAPKKESYRQELELLVQRLGLSGYVEFLGNRRDVPQLLAQTDVLVMSSVVPEAFGRVIVEAQAVGVPVVATEVGGVVEIIEDGKTGLLVLPKDPDAMASAVVRVLNEPKLSAQLAVNARKKLEEQFTLDRMAKQTIAVYRELLNSLNILVIKVSSVGDVILATASLKALRKKYPYAKIHCLVGKESRPLLQRCPYLDGIIVFDPRGNDSGWGGTARLASKLRGHKFDKVIDLQNNFKSHLLAFLAFPRESYGYNNGKGGFLLSHPVKSPRHDIPPVDHQFQVLKMLGIERKAEDSLELWPTEKDDRTVQTMLDSEWLGNVKNVVGMNIAASSRWATKNWPVEHYAKLCDMLAADGVRVAITGMEKDRAVIAELLKLTKTKPAVFAGKTDVMELAALIRRCKVYVTPDSAPMHIAAAMGVPFIAFFGPTASGRHLPPSGRYRVLERKLSCAPCYSSACRVKTHACLKEILPEDVARQVRELLERAA